MRCKAERCGTGVPPMRAFCTDHMKKLPYSITKNLWGEAEQRKIAIQDGIDYLKELEAA